MKEMVRRWPASLQFRWEARDNILGEKVITAVVAANSKEGFASMLSTLTAETLDEMEAGVLLSVRMEDALGRKINFEQSQIFLDAAAVIQECRKKLNDRDLWKTIG